MRGVSQISPPIRILLVAVVGLMAAWMLFLRPSAEEAAVPAATAPTSPVTNAGRIAEKAEAAADAQEARDGKVQQAIDGKTGAATAPATGTAKTGVASGRVLTLAPLADTSTKGLPAGIRDAFARRQVFAIGVFNTRRKSWAPMPADDREVRRELAKANRYGGKVTVAVTSLGEISKLHAVLGNVVTQSPSVVVVDRNRQATVLTGYVDRGSINQAIADARRNTIERRITDSYLSDVNELCGQYALRLDRFQLPRSQSAMKPASRRLSRLVATYSGRFGGLAAPARWKPMKTHLMTAMRRDQKLVAGVGAGNPAMALELLAGADLALAGSGATSCVAKRPS
jgi:hypothetical protein